MTISEMRDKLSIGKIIKVKKTDNRGNIFYKQYEIVKKYGPYVLTKRCNSNYKECFSYFDLIQMGVKA